MSEKKSLTDLYPDIAGEWHPTKNGELTPEMTTPKSGKKVWWLGKCGHEWQSVIASRTNGHGCPYCSGNKVLAGFNDLAALNPHLAKEWHPARNGSLTSNMISPYSNKKVWWLGKCGHEWIATVNSRSYGNGCPVCSSQTVLSGFNDLRTKAPEIAKEWHPTKNGKLKPDMVTSQTGKKVWWLGKCGHEWQAAISHRTNGRGCPFCANKKVLKGDNDFATLKPELPDEWHPSKNGTLSPDSFTAGSHKKVWWLGKCGHEWQASIKDRIRGTGCPVCANKLVRNRYNELATEHPDVASEWHPTKNQGLMPAEITSGSSMKVWWLGKCGHTYQMTVLSKVNGSRCPVCANTQVLSGYNDLATTYPTLAKEWHFEKNNKLTPTMVVAGSDKKVWWLGECGHEWQATIESRTRGGNGCPVCSKEQKTSFPEQAIYYYVKKYYEDAINGDRTIIGVELDILIPSLMIAIEYDGYRWHKDSKYENTKNQLCQKNNIKLIRVREEGLPVFDTCCCIIRENVNKKSSLNEVIKTILVKYLNVDTPDADIQRDESSIYESYVLGKKEKSLERLSFNIAQEWHPTKNGRLRPDMVAARSKKKVWWLGKCGHEWQASVDTRYRGNGCPICANKLVLAGFNDLQTRNPIIAQEWHPTKNGALAPNLVTLTTHKKIWWLGKCGHEWQAPISTRTGGHNCPFCSGNRILVGFNDLFTVNPSLANEWNYEKNGTLSPNMVTPTSHKKVWWLGKCGHEWQATVNHRARSRGCPICSNSQILVGYNDLSSKNPCMAEEWHPTKNGNLTPNMVVPGSEKKVWWLGKCGHEWYASIASRTKGSGCQICSGRQVQTGVNDLATTNPNLVTEWNYYKNSELTPQMVVAGSDKKVWWLGKCGHEWKTAVKERVRGRSCPICAGKKILTGFNDLATLNPQLAKEWHPTKNRELTPEKVGAGSGKKVWWICSKGHEWQSIIAYRNNGKCKCPSCMRGGHD